MLTEQQRHERDEAIYASDMPDILCDVSTRNIVIAEKAGIIPRQNLDGIPAIQSGNRLERVLIDWACESLNVRPILDDKTMTDARCDVLKGHVDALLYPDNAGLEIKVVGIGQSKHWGKSESDVPLAVYIQCQAYMAITGRECWFVFALINSTEPRLYKLDRDENSIEIIRAKAEEAWDDVRSAKAGTYNPIEHIDTCDPRSIAAVKRMQSMVELDDSSPVELDPYYQKLYERKQKLEEKKTKIQRELDSINAAFSLALGDATKATCADYFTIQRKSITVKPKQGYTYIRTYFKEKK